MEKREVRRLGRIKRETPLWWRRYNTLKREGFVHDEASPLAEGRIATRSMLRGRRARRKWYAKITAGLKMTPEEYEDAVNEMYADELWSSEYDQFYPEEYRMSTYEETNDVG